MGGTSPKNAADFYESVGIETDVTTKKETFARPPGSVPPTVEHTSITGVKVKSGQIDKIRDVVSDMIDTGVANTIAMTRKSGGTWIREAVDLAIAEDRGTELTAAQENLVEAAVKIRPKDFFQAALDSRKAQGDRKRTEKENQIKRRAEFTETREQLEGKTKNELKEIAKDLGVRTTGNKPDIVNRILDAVAEAKSPIGIDPPPGPSVPPPKQEAREAVERDLSTRADEAAAQSATDLRNVMDKATPTEAPAEGPFYAASKQAIDEQEIDPITGRVVDPLKEWDEETHGPATDAFGESLNPGDVIEDKFGTKYRVKANGMLAQLKDDGSESGNYFRLRKRKSRDTAAEYEADTDARTLLATSRLVEKTEGAAWPAKMKRKKKKAPAQAPTEAAEGVEAYLEDDMPESYRKRFIEGAKPFIEGVTSRPPNTKQEFLREAHSRMEGGADSGLLKRYMMDILAGKPAPKNSNIKVYEDRLQARLLLEQLENNAVETDTVLYRGDRPVTAGIDYTKVEPGDVIEVKGRPLIRGITTD